MLAACFMIFAQVAEDVRQHERPDEVIADESRRAVSTSSVPY
jgi:hypothetical protein